MGRNRKPKALHELSGTFEKHPERRAAYEHEPKPRGPLGDPPNWIGEDDGTTEDIARQLNGIWDEIVTQAPPGVLTISDRIHVELTCHLILRIRSGMARSGDYVTAGDFLGKMAMNPTDRPKLQVGVTPPAPIHEAKEAPNTFEQLKQEERASRVN